MIIQNEMLAIKSTENVIRSVCFEFNHFSIDQMDILRHIISEYLETDTAIFTKGKSCIIKCNDNFIEKRLLNEGIRIYDELLSVLNIELHIWGKPSKKGVLYVSAPFHLDGITPKHIKQCIIKIVKKMCDDIYFRLIKIDSVQIKSNFFVQDIPIWDGDFNGKYDFGVIKVDFGSPNPNRQAYKRARCLIKYNQYKIGIENQPVFSFIERTSKIYLTLLQCFLRFPIYELSEDMPFFSSNFQGKYISVDRNDYRKEYINDIVNNTFVPNDIAELFSKYEHLSEEEKTVFFNALCSYCEGMKNEGLKAISYYVICIETLSSYEAKKLGLTNINKIDMIFEFLRTVFAEYPIEHQTIESLYSIRSAYVHNGIANNDFLDEIFMKSLISNSNCKIVERIANYTLIIWLKRK